MSDPKNITPRKPPENPSIRKEGEVDEEELAKITGGIGEPPPGDSKEIPTAVEKKPIKN